MFKKHCFTGYEVCPVDPFHGGSLINIPIMRKILYIMKPPGCSPVMILSCDIAKQHID